jgi:hypothetical protein
MNTNALAGHELQNERPRAPSALAAEPRETFAAQELAAVAREFCKSEPGLLPHMEFLRGAA